MHKVAIIQHAPVLLDREETLARAAALIGEAARAGARLVVFPEAFVAGYPAWIWRTRPGLDWTWNEQLHQRLLDSAVTIGAGHLDGLYAAARQHGVTVVCGMNEIDPQAGKGTLYNTAVIIGPDGELRNRHRKLMPTNPERMVWGFGDGTGLRAVDTPAGRVATLICWENYMPLARYALYTQGVEIYVAPTYDSGDKWVASMQHIAREGRCWVIGSGVALTRSDLPADFPGRDTLYPAGEEWINPGDSVLVAPGGDLVAGPLREEQGILYGEVDAQRTVLAKRDLDITGHYARPDLFTLHVDSRPQHPVEFASYREPPDEV